MKTIWFVLMLSVAAALEMQAQVALNLATNIFGSETSPSASNDVHQSLVENMAKTAPSFDPVSLAMRAPETNQFSQTAIQAAVVMLTADQQTAMPEEIELLPEGAIARFGPHQVIFAADAKTPGAITLRIPSGERLRSTVFGLVYFSPDWKQSAMIAELKSTAGELLSGNRERRAGL